MRYFAILLALVLLGVAASAQDAPATDAGRQAFDAGRQAYDTGKFEDAKANFLEALKAYEGDPVVLTWLGISCYALHQWDEAITYLTQATEANPNDPVAHNNLGNAYFDKGDPLLKAEATAGEGRDLITKAVTAYEKALSLKPDYFHAVYNLALVYAALGQWDSAWKQFHTATKLQPNDAEAWRSFGRALKQAGEFDKAVERYQEAARLDPQCLECFLQRGWIYSKQARWPEAQGAYRSAIAIDAANFDAQFGLGIALYSQRKCDEAKAPLQKAADLKADSFEVRYNLGLASDCLNDAAGAEAAYSAAKAIKGDDAPCLNNLGVAIFNQSRPCDAIEQFKAAIAADDQYVMAYVNLAMAMEGCGQDPNGALKQWQDTATKFPGQASVHCGLADALYRKNQVNDALTEYLRCLELDERNVDAHNNVGLIFLDRDQLNEAVAHFRQALAVNPNYVPAINNLGVAYEKQGKADQAKEMYQKALQIDPSYDKAKENLNRLTKPAGGG